MCAGGRDPENPARGGKEEGGDFSFPGDAERHPDSDGAAQREKRQPSTREHRAGRKTQEAVRTVQTAGRGELEGFFFLFFFLSASFFSLVYE